jgi:hypothetical protein
LPRKLPLVSQVRFVYVGSSAVLIVADLDWDCVPHRMRVSGLGVL